MALLDKLAMIKLRFDDVAQQIIEPEVIADMKRYVKLNKEFKDLMPIVDAYKAYKMVCDNIDESNEILEYEDDPEMKEVFEGIDKFMEDDDAKELFTKMQSTAESLQMKQQSGMELTAGEIEEYNKARDKMMENPVATGFVTAQNSIQKVHETIGKAVSMVFENGRVPTDEEFESHCCGSGGCGSC